MGKRLLIGLIILILAIAGLPPLLGIMAERQVHARIDGATANPYVNYEIGEYNRGLYTSDGKINVALSDQYIAMIGATMASQDADEQPTPEQQATIDKILEFFRGQMTFDFEMHHGPVAFADSLKFGLASVHSEFQPAAGKLAEFQQRMNLPYLMQIDTLVNFNGSSDFVASVPPMSGGEELSFDFTGFTSQGHFTRNLGSLQTTGSSRSLKFESDKLRMTVENFSFDSNNKKLNEYMWLGDSQFDIGGISFTGPAEHGSMSIVLRELGMDFDVNLTDTGDKLYVLIDYHLAEVAGLPETALEDLQVGMRLKDIDLEAAQDYVEMSYRLAAATPETMNEVVSELQSVGERILRGSPGIEIEPVKFTWNSERFFSKLVVDFDGGALPATLDIATLGENPEWLTGAITGRGNIETSEKIARAIATNIVRGQIAATIPPDVEVSDADIDAAADAQADALLGQLVQQGLIELTDGELRTDLEFSNGVLSVNGTPIPLGAVE